jgi:transcriptional regulator with XRE-family HTH domain
MISHDVSTQNARTFSTLLLAVSLAPREIGERIRLARERKGWTQLNFAIEAGVSPSSVQRWEAGKLPRVRRLMELAELLDVEVSEFIEPVSDRDAEMNARLARIEQALEELAARL